MPTPLARADFFAIMSVFPTGVAIVTTLDEDGEPRGLTTNAMCSVSAEPPLLLVCVDVGSRTLRALRHSGRFVVNFMSDRTADLCGVFASKADDKFGGVGGSPASAGCLCSRATRSPMPSARRSRSSPPATTSS